METPNPAERLRLDVALVARALAASRTVAHRMVADGRVLVNGAVCVKPSCMVEPGWDIEIRATDTPQFVGQGGLKLQRAVEVFSLDFQGLRVIDLGASTGGFTHCALEHGATRVWAVDVGTAQLHPSLQDDSRVVSLEGTHVKDLTLAQCGGRVAEALVADLSFISLTYVIPRIPEFLAVDGFAVLLVKPQFEVGPKGLDRHGLVRRGTDQLRAITRVVDAARIVGLYPHGLTFSPLGGKGRNTEYLLYLRFSPSACQIDAPRVVQEAEGYFRGR